MSPGLQRSADLQASAPALRTAKYLAMPKSRITSKFCRGSDCSTKSIPIVGTRLVFEPSRYRHGNDPPPSSKYLSCSPRVSLLRPYLTHQGFISVSLKRQRFQGLLSDSAIRSFHVMAESSQACGALQRPFELDSSNTSDADAFGGQQGE
jgi:hypothetical protein